MQSVPGSRGIPRRMISMLGVSMLVMAITVSLAPAALAVQEGTCQVKNASTGATFGALQEAIDAAESGQTLKIKGICWGGSSIAKDLTLVGMPTAAFPVPTLSGNGEERVLYVDYVKVVIKNLLVTEGNAPGNGASAGLNCSGCYRGGGIYNDMGTVIVKGSARVNQNQAASGGGIYNYMGTVTLKNTAQVNGNEADFGGGIYNYVGLVTLKDSAQVNDNKALIEGGGIYNTGGNGPGLVGLAQPTGGIVTLGDSAKVNHNSAGNPGEDQETAIQPRTNGAAGEGGGIFTSGGTIVMNRSSEVNFNTATFDGGGIFECYATLDGPVDGDNVKDNDPNDISGCITPE